MRVLHAIPSIALHHGGPSQSVAGLLNAMANLPEKQAQVSLICGQHMQEPRLSNIQRHELRYWLQRYWCPAPASIADMRRTVGSADIVHVHSYWNGMAAMMISLARHAGKSVVLSPRGCLQSGAVHRSSARIKQLFAVAGGRRQLAGLSGCHFQTEDEAIASIGVAGLPSIIVDNGVASPAPAQSRTELRAQLFPETHSKLNLVFLGRMARIKGIDLQLEALHRLRAGGHDAVLHLVGPDGGDLARLRAMASDLGVTDSLYEHGPVYSERKLDWLYAADAVLMSSEFENNSNAALEAMAAGGRLIATAGSVADAPVKAGAVIRVPRNAEALARAIAGTGPSAMRKNARAYVLKHHDWTSRAALMISFYESLL